MKNRGIECCVCKEVLQKNKEKWRKKWEEEDVHCRKIIRKGIQRVLNPRAWGHCSLNFQFRFFRYINVWMQVIFERTAWLSGSSPCPYALGPGFEPPRTRFVFFPKLFAGTLFILLGSVIFAHVQAAQMVIYAFGNQQVLGSNPRTSFLHIS